MLQAAILQLQHEAVRFRVHHFVSALQGHCSNVPNSKMCQAADQQHCSKGLKLAAPPDDILQIQRRCSTFCFTAGQQRPLRQPHA